jgi:hypothetical protein
MQNQSFISEHARIILPNNLVFFSLINISLVLFCQYKLHKMNPQIQEHPERRQFQVMVYLYMRQCFLKQAYRQQKFRKMFVMLDKKMIKQLTSHRNSS